MAAIVLGGEEQAYADRAFIHYGKDGLRPSGRAPTGCGRAVGARRLRRHCPTPCPSACCHLRPLRTSRSPTSSSGRAGGADVPRRLRLRGATAGSTRSRGSGRNTRPSARERARLIQGVNAAREFKEIQPDDTVSVREPDAATGAGLLAPIMDVTAVRKWRPSARTRVRRPRWHGSCARRSHRRGEDTTLRGLHRGATPRDRSEVGTGLD